MDNRELDREAKQALDEMAAANMASDKGKLPFSTDFLDEDLAEAASVVSTSDRLMLIFLAQVARNTGRAK